MNRCHTAMSHVALGQRARLALAALLLSFGFAASASAQESIRRDAPQDVKLGQMAVTLPPVIKMDGKDDRLSPGSRIRDARNMLVLSGSLAGSTVPVVYKRDGAGLVHEVWILTEGEYKQLGGAGGDAQKFVDLLAAIFGARR